MWNLHWWRCGSVRSHRSAPGCRQLPGLCGQGAVPPATPGAWEAVSAQWPTGAPDRSDRLSVRWVTPAVQAAPQSAKAAPQSAKAAPQPARWVRRPRGMPGPGWWWWNAGAVGNTLSIGRVHVGAGRPPIPGW